MNQRFIDEHQVVLRYFSNQLSELEEQSFMRYLRSHPQAIDELAAVGDFRLGIAAMRNSGELTELVKPHPWSRYRAWIALAASVLIAVLAVGFGFRSPNNHPVLAAAPTLLDPLGAPLPSAGAYAIFRSRSRRNEIDIRLPVQPGSIELRVLPENPSAASYRITLARLDEEGGGEPATLAQLYPGEDGFISLHVASAALVTARYRITVESIASLGSVESTSMFVLRITRDADAVRR